MSFRTGSTRNDNAVPAPSSVETRSPARAALAAASSRARAKRSALRRVCSFCLSRITLKLALSSPVYARRNPSMPSRASAAATAAAAASSAAAAAKPREGVAGAERAEVSAMSRRASGKPSGSRHWSSASASHGSLVAAALAGECARVCAVWSSLAPPSRSENEGDASPAPRSRSSLLWMARCASRTRAGSPLFVARSQRRVSRSFGTSGKYSRVMMASRRATYSSSSSTTGPARRGARGAGGGISSAPASRRDATAGGPAPPTAALPSAEDMPRDARARCGRARCGRARAGLAVLGRALDSSTFSAPAPFSPLRRARFLESARDNLDLHRSHKRNVA